MLPDTLPIDLCSFPPRRSLARGGRVLGTLVALADIVSELALGRWASAGRLHAGSQTSAVARGGLRGLGASLVTSVFPLEGADGHARLAILCAANSNHHPVGR
jgi:hypothetical protein